MKRIISLLLCLVLACLALVSCGETEIGKHYQDLKDKFYKEPEAAMTLKLYVIYDEAHQDARDEIRRRIKSLTKAEYNTTLDVVYCTAEEYSGKIEKAIELGEKAIVLIPNANVMKSLYGDGTEVTVTQHFEKTKDASVVKVVTTYSASGVTVQKYDEKDQPVAGEIPDASKVIRTQVSVGNLEELSSLVKSDKYGLLNAKIASSLFDASILDYKLYNKDYDPEAADEDKVAQFEQEQKKYAHDGSLAMDENGKPIMIDKIFSGLFSIPNNHLIGGTEGYKYVKINRQACEIWLNHTETFLRGVKDDAAIEALRAELRALNKNPDDYVQIINGSYATKAADEADEKYILNVLETPITSAEDAFSGAFAVLKGTDTDRAMRMIYAINMDSALHNLLQYGIKDTNYQIHKIDGDDVVVRIDDIEGKQYNMNILYTGNAFSAYYCEDVNWTPEIQKYAESQNIASNKAYEEKKAAELQAKKDADEALQAEMKQAQDAKKD